MPVVARAFFVPAAASPEAGGDQGSAGGIREAPFLCVLPLCLTALGCLLLFIYAGPIYDLLLPIAGGGG